MPLPTVDKTHEKSPAEGTVEASHNDQQFIATTTIDLRVTNNDFYFIATAEPDKHVIICLPQKVRLETGHHKIMYPMDLNPKPSMNWQAGTPGVLKVNSGNATIDTSRDASGTHLAGEFSAQLGDNKGELKGTFKIKI